MVLSACEMAMSRNVWFPVSFSDTNRTCPIGGYVTLNAASLTDKIRTSRFIMLSMITCAHIGRMRPLSKGTDLGRSRDDLPGSPLGPQSPSSVCIPPSG